MAHTRPQGLSGAPDFIEIAKLYKLIEIGNGSRGWQTLDEKGKDSKLKFMQLKSPYYRSLAIKVMSSMAKPNLESYRLPETPAGKKLAKIISPYKGKYVWLTFLDPKDEKMINVLDSTISKYKAYTDLKLIGVFNEATCSKSQLDSIIKEHPSIAKSIYMGKDDWYIVRDQYLGLDRTKAFDKRGFMFTGRNIFRSVSDFSQEWNRLMKQEKLIIQCKDDTRLVFR